MQVSDIFFGSLGRVYSSSCIVMILLMMFIVSLRLFLSRRKKAYFSLTISITIVIAQYGWLIGWELSGQAQTGYWSQVLKVIAFILINMGIYQLYNSSKSREYGLFFTFIGATLLIAALHFYALSVRPDPSASFILLHSIWIELYLFILIFLCFYLVMPFIGQRKKYQYALFVYFIMHLAYVVNEFIAERTSTVLYIAGNYLPIVYFAAVFLILFERIVELMQATYKSSITDGLTGLFNRRHFYNSVAQYLSRQRNIAIIFTDIDFFKKLNDTKGHHVGDATLKQVAEIIQEEVNEIGIAGRYGGEELVAMITDPKCNVAEVAEKIRKRVQLESPVTISIGYSKSVKGIKASELIKRADDAMYRSKTSGKNKVTSFSELKGGGLLNTK